MTVTWKGYEDGGHWVNEPEGLDDLNDFIKEAFRSTRKSVALWDLYP